MTNFSKKLARLVKLTLLVGGGEKKIQKLPNFFGGERSKICWEKKKQIISPTHIELTLSFQNDSIPNLKTEKKRKKKKKGTNPCNNNAFNRLRNLIVKQQARKPSSKQKRRKKGEKL